MEDEMGHVACMEMSEVDTDFHQKPEGKRPFGRHRCRWEDNNKMDLIETVCQDMD
jgi:hypothetical protein